MTALEDVIVVTNDFNYDVNLDAPHDARIVIPYVAKCRDELLPFVKDAIIFCWRYLQEKGQESYPVAGMRRGSITRGLYENLIAYSMSLSKDDFCLSPLEMDTISSKYLNSIRTIPSAGVFIWDSYIWVREGTADLIPERPEYPTNAHPSEDIQRALATGACVYSLQRRGVVI